MTAESPISCLLCLEPLGTESRPGPGQTAQAYDVLRLTLTYSSLTMAWLFCTHFTRVLMDFSSGLGVGFVGNSCWEGHCRVMRCGRYARGGCTCAYTYGRDLRMENSCLCPSSHQCSIAFSLPCALTCIAAFSLSKNEFRRHVTLSSPQ